MGACLLVNNEERLDIGFAAHIINKLELTKLRKAFDSMNIHHFEKLDIEVILRVWGIENSNICRKALSLYGQHDSTTRVSFKQFVLLVWHICIISQHAMGYFVFEMCDEYRRGILMTDDVIKGLKLLKVPQNKIDRYDHQINVNR